MRGWRLALLMVGILLIASVTGFYFISGGPRGGESSLTIYTYGSLFKYGDDPNATYAAVFGAFERQYNVNITVRYFSDAGDIIPALLSERNSPKADLVIGLTSVLAAKAKQENLLQPYAPPSLSKVPTYLVNDLDPDHYVVPYEYGLIAIDIDGSYINESAYPSIGSLSYEDLRAPALASSLLVENPATSSVGQDFLLSQIVFYQQVLKSDWKPWWRSVRDYVKVVPGWDDAFGIFSSANTNYHMVVSFGTDPAYSAYFNYTMYRTVVPQHNGTMYGWLQIEGMGIVNNAPHADTAKAFEEWMLSDVVQNLIPLNEWVYPAVSTVQLPDVYKFAIDPSKVSILNNLVPTSQLAQNLPQWLEEWQSIMAGS